MDNVQLYALATFFLFFVLRFAISRYRRISISHLPGPQPESFLLGNLRQLFQDDIGEEDFKLQEMYGETMRIKSSFGEDNLLLMDPKGIQYVLGTTKYRFAKPHDRLITLVLSLGKGLVSVEGDEHQRQRRVLLPAFGNREMRDLMPMFRENIQKLVINWKDALIDSRDGTIVYDVLNEATLATLDAVGKAAFEYDFGILERKGNALATSFTNFLVEGFGLPTNGTLLVQHGIMGRIPGPLLKLATSLPLAGIKRFKKHGELCDSIARELIDAKGRALQQGKAGRDVLSLIVKANLSQNERTKLSDEELLAEFRTIMGAGHETTSNTLTWVLLELSRHPEMQTKLRREIQRGQAAAYSRGQAEMSMQDMEALPYLGAVIKETLRFHAVFSHMFRTATEDDVIPLSRPVTTASGRVINEIPVPKGMRVIVSIAGYNRLRELWGQDAQLYRPERWLDGSICKYDGTSVGVLENLMSFGSGPHACIGWHFALVQLHTILVELISNFEFALTDDARRVRRVAALFMLPMIEGQSGRPQLPLKISLVE
ncbi:hypothetical protein SERLA73DRAFT_113010 [Serpula lacrymans var. lacrymans S7.3]|uniref:Cytochrome P450 n=2 Tax=Serpula lacrymans var. lacrymans TaxID=341189 RepID=F8Q7C6_SERL3|nr:uncharacterized protein SERLADRAFT_417432 [Serpula lacrymans var. lacrymans S7.9]EGN95464.1 hypothetical protein SERLA73DRAFT_113010 [Serpula lacrymans var. lacrymans S7.3]EGO20992.1 hypothetical protein SERLADRAFT_417432 [Serpula lacrymans var. lacrymans S7.9]